MGLNLLNVPDSKGLREMKSFTSYTFGKGQAILSNVVIKALVLRSCIATQDAKGNSHCANFYFHSQAALQNGYITIVKGDAVDSNSAPFVYYAKINPTPLIDLGYNQTAPVILEGAFSPSSASITLGYPTVTVQSDGTAAVGYAFVGNVTLATDPLGQSQSAYAGTCTLRYSEIIQFWLNLGVG